MPEPDADHRLVAIFTTTADRDSARHIARTLVQRRLVACAQMSDIESVYVWQDAVQQAPECRLLLKTTAAQQAAVEAAVRELHPYELPALYTVAIDRADAAYAQWVMDNSAGR